MAQIIKHRRGSITDVKGLTNRNGEIVIASGSINDLSGPFALYGSPVLADEGVAGAFKATSKLYQGGTAPTISNATYGSVLDGTPFHSTNANALYILNNDGVGNQKLNLSGNLENTTVTNLTVTNLTGSTANITSIIGDLTGTASYATQALTASYASNADTLDGNDSTYYLNASNINAGTIGDAYLPATISSDITGTASYADEALTASYALNATSSSYALNATSSSHAVNADTASYVDYSNIDSLPDFDALYVNVTGDTITGNLNVSASINIQGGGVSASYFSGSFFGDGSNLAGLATTLNISGDTGTTTLDLLTQTLGVVGTTNEIETSVNSGVVTIGLPDEVTIQTGSIANNLTVGGNLLVSGNFTVLGGVSEVHISSSVVEIDDNIITLNAYSPYERYGGLEVIDSGSTGLSGSFLWDSEKDIWLSKNVSGQTSTTIGTNYGSIGNEATLTTNTIPRASGNNTIEDSLLTDNGTTLVYNLNKFSVNASNGATTIAGNVTLSSVGGSDAGSNSSSIVFKNSSNVLGYVSTTETTDVLDGILGYRSSDGILVFSTVIDGGTF